MKPKFAFTVLYAHRGDDATPFMGFHRDDKQRAFDCLRRLSMAWPNTTYWLRKGRKTLVRIERGEIHRSRASAYHQAHMRFKAQMAAIERANAGETGVGMSRMAEGTYLRRFSIDGDQKVLKG